MSTIRVHAKRPGFRRAGLEFGHEPRELDVDALTAEQLRQIHDEPMLVVEEMAEPSKGGSGKSQGGKAGGKQGE